MRQDTKDNLGCAFGVALVIVVIGVIVGGIMLGSCTTSDGVRVGIVNKFSYKGIWQSTKSWEGEMVLGGGRAADSGVTANVWEFSVLDSKIVEQIKAAASSQHKVQLRYHQTFTFNPRERSTSCLIMEVTDLDAANATIKPER